MPESLFAEAFAEGGFPQLQEEFGREVSYTAAGEDAATIAACVSFEDGGGLEESYDGNVVSKRATLTIWARAADGIAAPARGDLVSIDGESYAVVSLLIDTDAEIATLGIEQTGRVDVGRGDFQRGK